MGCEFRGLLDGLEARHATLEAVTATIFAPDAYVYQVLFDTDVDPASGCDVAVDDAIVGAQTVHGIERIAIVAVTRDVTGGSITGITRRVCVGGTTFDTPLPVSAGGWAVGVGNGIGGADVVEGFISRAALGNPPVVREYFTALRAWISLPSRTPSSTT